MKNSFFLGSATQKRTSPDFKRFEKSEIQKFINQSGSQQYAIASRLVQEHLLLLNSLKVDQKVRQNANDALRQLIFDLQKKLLNDFIGDGFPKSKAEKETYQLYISLEKEYASSYWFLLKEQLGKSVKWQLNAKKNTATIIHRIMRCLLNIMKAASAMHDNLPNFFWLDLHSFYNFSLEELCGDIKIADITSDIAPSSIIDLYRECILYKLIDSDNLMPKEIYQIEKVVEELAKFLQIRKERIRTQRQQCLILIHEDQAPFWLTSETRKVDTSERYVDLTDLHLFFNNCANYVHQEESRFKLMLDISKDKNKVPKDLLKHIEHKLSCIEVKIPPIFRDRLRRLYSVGIDAAYLCKMGKADNMGVSLETFADSESPTSLSCKIEKSNSLSIGSFVSFRKEDDPESNRSIGIINKITQAAKEKVIFEVKTLAIKFDVGRLETIDFESSNADSNYVVMFSSTERGKKTEYLISKSYLLSETNTFSLYKGQYEYIATLKNQRCIGSDTWQYEIAVLKPIETE